MNDIVLIKTTYLDVTKNTFKCQLILTVMRKKLIVYLFLTGILLGLNPLQVLSQDWPQWRGLNRDSKVTGFQNPQSWPQQLNPTWKVDVGSADATPALVSNKLYVFTRQGNEEILQCLDAVSGNQIWQTDGYAAPTITGPAASHPGPRSSPAVADGKVITLGVAGVISCYDATSGNLLWRNEDYANSYPQFFIGMSPLVTDGVCIAHLGGTGSGQFIAFDLATGNIKWKTAGDAPGYGSPALMNVNGTKICVFQGDAKLVGVDVSNGTILWDYTIPLPTSGRADKSTSPVIDQQKVYFTGFGSGVHAIEITKQGSSFAVNNLWTNSNLNATFNTPVLKDGFLYGLSSTNKLFCINASNGESTWVDDTPIDRFGSIIDAGDVLVALSSKSDLIIYKPSNQEYSPVGLIKVADTPVYAQPILSGKNIFIKDENSIIKYTLN